MNRGYIFLFITVSVWGIGLVSQQAGMNVMGPLSFTGVRCLLGGLSMIPLVLILNRKKSFGCNKFDSHTLKVSLICGIMLLVVTLCQQFGLVYTSVGKGAFITDFYIFITPIIGILLGQKVGKKMWLAVILAMVGLYFITMTEGIEKLNAGDLLMFCAAVSYAVYIQMADKMIDGVDTITMSCIQFIVMGLVSLVLAVIFEPGDITWANCTQTWLPILYSGIISCDIGYTCQLLGQERVEPTKASLILSLEACCSLMAGHLILGEVLHGREYLGCVIMMAAIVISIIPGKNKSKNP